MSVHPGGLPARPHGSPAVRSLGSSPARLEAHHASDSCSLTPFPGPREYARPLTPVPVPAPRRGHRHSFGGRMGHARAAITRVGAVEAWRPAPHATTVAAPVGRAPMQPRCSGARRTLPRSRWTGTPRAPWVDTSGCSPQARPRDPVRPARRSQRGSVNVGSARPGSARRSSRQQLVWRPGRRNSSSIPDRGESRARATGLRCRVARTGPLRRRRRPPRPGIVARARPHFTLGGRLASGHELRCPGHCPGHLPRVAGQSGRPLTGSGDGGVSFQALGPRIRPGRPLARPLQASRGTTMTGTANPAKVPHREPAACRR